MFNFHKLVAPVNSPTIPLHESSFEKKKFSLVVQLRESLFVQPERFAAGFTGRIAIAV